MKNSDNHFAPVLTANPYPSKTLAGILLSVILLFSLISFSSQVLVNLFGAAATKPFILYATRLLFWLALGIIWLFAVKIEKQNFLPWNEHNYGFLHGFISVLSLIGIMFIGCIIINIILLITHANISSDRLKVMLVILKKDRLLLVFTALTAGIVEEFIIRGYLQPRLQQLFKKPWIAITISSVIFGALHYGYGTLGNVLGPMFIGFVFAVYYYKYRNLKVVIIAHFLWDLLLLLIQTRK